MAKRRGRPPGRATQTAQSFGAMLGSVAAKVDSWVAQRDDIATELNGVIQRAQQMLTQLGGGEDLFPRRSGRTAGNAGTAKSVTKRKKGGRRKGFKMSPEARAKISAAAKARWAKQKGEATTFASRPKAKKTGKAKSG